MSNKRKPKILVVDDQPINIKLLQRKLERQGMDISVAYSGRECLDIVHKVNPDLILLDVMMPDLDGIETCQKLKSDPETEAIPIIFITAKASKEGKLEGLDAGAVDYITKPIDLDETLARVRTQLRLQEMFRENIHLQERLGDARRTAAVGAITQGITHNLNNLLGVVVGYLDLLKNAYDNPDMIKRSVGLIDQSTNRMVEIVRQLGTIANNDRYELASLSVTELLESSIERLHSEHNIQARVELKTDFTEDPTIHANAETFESVVGKLLINAWESYGKDATDDERKITLSAHILSEEGSSMLNVLVIDNGKGIKPEIHDTIFEPFITTKTSVGRGMGLTIARHTIRNLGGDVIIDDNPDGGAIATITHPI